MGRYSGKVELIASQANCGENSVNQSLRESYKARLAVRLEYAKNAASNYVGKFRWSFGGTVVHANSRSEARARFKTAFRLTRLPPNAVIKKMD